MTLRKRLISLCMVMVLVFSLSAVCASAAQEAAAEQPTVSMSFDLDNRIKHEKTVRLPDGSIAKITAEPINTGRALSGVWKIILSVGDTLSLTITRRGPERGFEKIFLQNCAGIKIFKKQSGMERKL